MDTHTNHLPTTYPTVMSPAERIRNAAPLIYSRHMPKLWPLRHGTTTQQMSVDGFHCPGCGHLAYCEPTHRTIHWCHNDCGMRWMASGQRLSWSPYRWMLEAFA